MRPAPGRTAPLPRCSEPAQVLTSGGARPVRAAAAHPCPGPSFVTTGRGVVELMGKLGKNEWGASTQLSPLPQSHSLHPKPGCRRRSSLCLVDKPCSVLLEGCAKRPDPALHCRARVALSLRYVLQCDICVQREVMPCLDDEGGVICERSYN